MQKISHLLVNVDYEGTLFDEAKGRTTPEAMIAYLKEMKESLSTIADQTKICILSSIVPDCAEELRDKAPIDGVLQIKDREILATRQKDLTDLAEWAKQGNPKIFLLDDTKPLMVVPKMLNLSAKLGREEDAAVVRGWIINYPTCETPAQLAEAISKSVENP